MGEIKWDIRRGAQIYRVIYNSRLKNWISTGKIKRGETMVWRSGFSGWRKPEELPELAPFFESWEKHSLSGEDGGIEPIKLKEQVVPQQKQIRNILIIDDEKDLCLLLSDALNAKGYHVATANTKREGMICLKKASPDLVFLDLKLPDGNGINILSAIRRLCPETIAIIISAYGGEESRKKAMKNGARGFIDKPFTESDILKRIMLFRKGKMV
ncbi:MAG: response regulator [Verrucomicrobia bacterium]|nr:response regulator [Verrucomicrobiota bacterium]MBU1733990.1 response regulator [Verrucomicrobiota bacterium]MBU1856644.1 response regulator [Verrucomicrobiota bacterium]